MIAIFDFVLSVIGCIAIAYCLLMLVRPGLAEDWAVWIVAWKSGQSPRSGDYRFAWTGLGYAILISAIFALRVFWTIAILYWKRRG